MGFLALKEFVLVGSVLVGTVNSFARWSVLVGTPFLQKRRK